MSSWTEWQKRIDADLNRRVNRLERMLSFYKRKGMAKQASQIPGRICRVKSRLATISLNSFKHAFRKSA